THLALPPGSRDVVEKLLLNGRFSLAAARFADPEAQQKNLTLSRRGRGINKQEEQGMPREDIASNLDAVLREPVTSVTLRLTWRRCIMFTQSAIDFASSRSQRL